MLSAIVAGRERATPHVANMVACALDEWGIRCRDEALLVWTAIRDQKQRRFHEG
jgi:hypothetical protein